MWSDNETLVDLLDIAHLQAAALSVIHNKDLLPATIGIFGDWGSGKSSLMRMVRAELEQEVNQEELVCISFNGWLFEGYDDARTALMTTILDEISSQRTLDEKAKDILERLICRLNLMRMASTFGKYALGYVAGGGVGVGALMISEIPALARQIAEKVEGVSEDDVGKFLKESAKKNRDVHISVRDFHEDFTDLLDKTKIETLVVLIDDLDRCNPDTIIETLEAIKLFLFAPQTVFIIGADETLIKYAVRRRFPELPGDKAEVGRDYLEKLIQFPIRIPPLGRVELETYINLLFAERANLDKETFEKLRVGAINRSPDHLYDLSFTLDTIQEIMDEVPPELRDGVALAGQLAPILTTGLKGNPRQTKRFLNTLMMRTAMADSRSITLERRVLAKLMLLEYFKPEAFKKLATLQAEHDGSPRELRYLEMQVRSSVLEETIHEPTPTSPASDPRPRSTSKSQDEAASQRRSEVRDVEIPGTELQASRDVELDSSVTTWLTDNWIKEWLMTEPPLADRDLRPYFYFSREWLEPFTGRAQRLSPLGREIFSKITSESDARRREAVDLTQGISEAEAAAVFNALAEQAKQQEDLSGDKSILDSLFKFVEVRAELQSQLLLLLDQLADSALAPAHVVQLVLLTKDSETLPGTRQLLERWSKSSGNSSLAAAAKSNLKRLSGERRAN